MGYSNRDEDWQADHFRGSRKHERHRLDVAIDGAMEVACAVRDATNHHAAAGLVQAYVKSEIARANLDAALERVMAATPSRCAAAKLIGYCEGMAKSGDLGFETEMQLRRLIGEALSAFGMCAANRAERETV